MRKPDSIDRKKITIYLNGSPVEAYEGEPVAVSLYAAGELTLGYSLKYRRPRGLYSLDFPCYMTINDVPNMNVCDVPAEDGMRIKVQEGRGEVLYD